ncbi:MAG TPA: serine/threonine-protein kinase [Gaiellaceae bacterium]|nr:serine/threonine-protein kinase [Gaiellaceae bacterium]
MRAMEPELPPRYRAPALLAHGGMADVYRAHDEALGRDVAVKLLADRYASDEELRARFTREAHTAARLSGEPHVVTIFDVGEAGGRPYIVMELVPGGSLADRLRSAPVTPAESLLWLGQAAEALDAAHRLGVVHRDVKPANLLLDASGSLRVTDFGIATAAGDDTLTLAGSILGTWGYMSPEQASGGRATAASDRYSLAAVAFELLTGHRPYAAETPTAEAHAHVTAPVPRASEVEPSLPRGVDAVLARGLAKRPDDRPASAGELVAALRAAFRADATATVVDGAAPVPVPAAAGRRRAPLVALGVAALLLAGVAGAALAAAMSGDDPASRVETQVLTVVRTQTTEGAPETTTVTVEAPTPPPPPAPPSPPPAPDEDGQSGEDLNDEAFRLMQEGDFAGALALLEQAVADLTGDGSLAEAYAAYNLAFTRFALGRCDGVAELLDRSEQVQGKRSEINRLRKDLRKTCGD